MKTVQLLSKHTKGQEKLYHNILKLRHNVFKEKLNWKVTSRNNEESDQYDKVKDANYVVVTNQNEEVIGCLRLLPTTGHYMIKNTFSKTFKNFKIPEQKDIWEMSRFAVDQKSAGLSNIVGFSETTAYLAKGMCDFALKKGIKSYIGLTTPHVERLIKNLGFTCIRHGGVELIDNLKVVIIQIDIDEKSIDAINKRIH